MVVQTEDHSNSSQNATTSTAKLSHLLEVLYNLLEMNERYDGHAWMAR